MRWSAFKNARAEKKARQEQERRDHGWTIKPAGRRNDVQVSEMFVDAEDARAAGRRLAGLGKD